MNAAATFAPEGPLAVMLPGYESRGQQVAMAVAVAEALAKSEHLMVEAGTGTGKSLAYLVPMIQWAVASGKRVIVSTYSKALQHQLVTQDLPLLQKALGLDFSYALCLGTNNYLCPRRLERAEEGGLFTSAEESRQFASIRRWSKRTRSGLVSELDFEPHGGVWSAVNRESDLCNGQECSHYDACPFYAARRRQYASTVLVSNHALFFANLAASELVLPPFDAVVLDEAHSIEDVAADFLGLSVANPQLGFLFDQIHNARTGKGVLANYRAPREFAEPIQIALAECQSASDLFFELVAEHARGPGTTTRLREPDFVEPLLAEPLVLLAERLRAWQQALSLPDERLNEEAKFEVGSFAARCDTLNAALNAILTQSQPNSVYWMQVAKSDTRRARRQPRVALAAAPVDLSDALRLQLFERYAPIVMTSATLTTAGRFDYLRQRLGLGDDVRALAVGSPFDWERQAMLYAPQDLPDPAAKEVFDDASIDRARKVLEIVGGGAFVLCTSYRIVQRAHEELSRALPHLRVLRQGEASRERLLDEFKQDGNGVLVATATFWQGIDVPGDALRCVILMRLPFSVPDEPLIEARMEHLQVNGIDPFYGYQVPQAIILLRQGFGRLLRTKNDRGLVAILDPRAVTRQYGRLFLESLPPCRRARNLDEVEKFFEDFAAFLPNK